MNNQLQKAREQVDWLRLQYGARHASAGSFERVRRRLERAERTLARLLSDKENETPTAPSSAQTGRGGMCGAGGFGE